MAIFDTIEKLDNCLIHHGKENNRIYLIQYDKRSQNEIVDALFALAQKNGYGKIIAKVPKSAAQIFLNAGYEAEARVPAFYGEKEDCLFLSLFLSPDRKNAPDIEAIKSVAKIAKAKKPTPPGTLCEGYSIAPLGRSMCDEMTSLYKNVFKTYPYPIFNPSYLFDTMEDNVAYFGVFFAGELVALSSAEMNKKYENAEMTDFAINPAHRGKGLAKHLLAVMEADMKKREIKTLYTIARAGSLPMNCTFAAMGYEFGGTMINNTQIAGRIESMNVWYKENNK